MVPLPAPSVLKQRFPAPLARIEKQRKEIGAIAAGNDPRFLIIVGPCSIHDEASALDYAQQFKELAEEVRESCHLVMRAFFEKPRTLRGWNGLLLDPDLDGSWDVEKGLWLSRKLLKTFTDMGIPTACEFLNPLAAPYLSDLVTWGIIGARTSSSPLHRHLVSGLPLPCSFKNGLDGSWKLALNSILTAREALARLTIDDEGRICQEFTSGNHEVYLTLRGSCQGPNSDEESIDSALNDLEEAGLPRRILVDCSHGNSGKQAQKQIEVFHSILEMRRRGKEEIFGVLLESFLEEGHQTLENPSLRYGVSITDPCLDWPATRLLIEEAAALHCRS